MQIQKMQLEILDVLQGMVCLKDPYLQEQVMRLAQVLLDTLQRGGKILIFGNGGSAADALHIAAELVGRYQRERQGLAALALNADVAILTAWSNDYNFDSVFSRQIQALGRPEDVAWGLSTSGQSRNVLQALNHARSMGMRTVALVGRDGGQIAPAVDVAVCVPLQNTARIQEVHHVIYHMICGLLDDAVCDTKAQSI